MDKRRYKSRSPRNPREPKGMDGDTTGNPALDGFTVLRREPLKRTCDRYGETGFKSGSLMDEQEARFRDIYGED